MKRLVVLFFVALVGAASVGKAEIRMKQQAWEITLADQLEISAVVTLTIDGIRETNPDKAYGTLSPRAYAMFPTKEIYLSALLERFTALAYATHIELGDTRLTSRGIAQNVGFCDRRGRKYEGFFLLTNEKGGWKIIGLIVVESPSDPS